MYFAFLTGSELLLVLVAVIVLFGATRLPQLGQSLGQGIRNFREAVGGKDKQNSLQEGQSKQAQEPSEKTKATVEK